MTTNLYRSLLANRAAVPVSSVPGILADLAPTLELEEVVGNLLAATSAQAPALYGDLERASAFLAMLQAGTHLGQLRNGQRGFAEVLGRWNPDDLERVLQATGWQAGVRQFVPPAQVRAGVEQAMLKAALRAGPSFHALTERLVPIPSISLKDGKPNPAVAEAITEVSRLMGEYGFGNIQVLSAEGANPSVYGEIVIDPELPTIFVYAHADVQPVGEGWVTEPFVPYYKLGRGIARGISDDKAGITSALAAARAYYDSASPPKVNIAVFFEGEEEVGSKHLGQLLSQIQSPLTPDLFLLVDSRNVTVETSTIGVSARGMALFDVIVRTADHGTHAGLDAQVTDAHMASAGLLIDLLNAERNSLVVPGLTDNVPPVPDLIARAIATFDNQAMEDLLRQSSGMRPGMRVFGDPTKHVLERVGWDYKVAVLAQEGTQSVKQIAGQNVHQATTVLQFRIPPGVSMDDAVAKLEAHLTGMRPFGAEVEVKLRHRVAPWLANLEDPTLGLLNQAFTWGYESQAAALPIGGSIGFLAEIQRRYPDVPIYLIPIEDPWSNPHAANETLDVATYVRTTQSLGAAFFLFGEPQEDGTGWY